MLELEPGDGREELGKLDPAPQAFLPLRGTTWDIIPALFKVHQVLVMFEIKNANATTRILRSMVN